MIYSPYDSCAGWGLHFGWKLTLFKAGEYLGTVRYLRSIPGSSRAPLHANLHASGNQSHWEFAGHAAIKVELVDDSPLPIEMSKTSSMYSDLVPLRTTREPSCTCYGKTVHRLSSRLKKGRPA